MAVKKQVEPEVKEVKQKKQPEYVHLPGTVHLNAYEADVRAAEVRVGEAEAELEAAKARLAHKREESNGN